MINKYTIFYFERFPPNYEKLFNLHDQFIYNLNPDFASRLRPKFNSINQWNKNRKQSDLNELCLTRLALFVLLYTQHRFNWWDSIISDKKFSITFQILIRKICVNPCIPHVHKEPQKKKIFLNVFLKKYYWMKIKERLTKRENILRC